METIEIIHSTMCVMDEDGNTHAAVALTGYRTAKRQVQTWTAEFTIDVAAAYRILADRFSR